MRCKITIITFILSIYGHLAIANGAEPKDLHPSHQAEHKIGDYDLKGKMARVIDGDTVVIRVGEESIRLRLHGVDAPERGQPFSRKAASFVRERVDGKTVFVKYTRNGKAAYNRSEGILFDGDGRNLNVELLENGFAAVDPGYCSPRYMEAWRAVEEQARQNRLGIWSVPGMPMPWEYRKETQQGDAAAREVRKALTSPFIGNTKSNVYHRTECAGSYGKNCTLPFADRNEAEYAGYRPCGRCAP